MVRSGYWHDLLTDCNIMFNQKLTVMKNIKIALYTGAIAFLGLTACKKDDMDTAPKNANSITVRMTDAPGDYAELNLELERVDIYLENSGWVTLSNESQMVNVLELTNGNSVTIANSNNIEAGLYTSVALYFGDDNDLMVENGSNSTSFDLSGQGAVIIDINQEVDANTQADLLLDFNVSESLHEAGGEIVLDPTIHYVDDPETGVQGQVLGGAFASIELSDGENTFSTFTDANGNFILQGIDEGTYSLAVMVDAEGSEGGNGSGSGGVSIGGIFGAIVNDDGAEAGGISVITIDNVGVVDGQITQMGGITIGG